MTTTYVCPLAQKVLVSLVVALRCALVVLFLLGVL